MRGFGGLLVLLLGAIVRFWWVIAAAVAIVVLGIALWRFTGWLDRRLDARERRRGAAAYARAQIVARADEQNTLFLAGDPRGVYGDFLPSQFGTS